MDMRSILQEVELGNTIKAASQYQESKHYPDILVLPIP